MQPVSVPIILVSPTQKNNEKVVSRPLAKFEPSFWGDRFLHFTPPNEVTKLRMEEEAKELKEEMRKKLLESIKKPKEGLQFIDAIQRLGVAYHFEDEIEVLLENFHNNKNNYNVNDCYQNNLHFVSLHFRLLRQHGFFVSSDVFNKFINENGSFKEEIASEVEGILSLYEASYLKVHGEKILEDALEFSTRHLMSLSRQVSSVLAEKINHALKRPIHRCIPRLEAKYQIYFYESEPSHDVILHKFAKLDFYLLQLLHKEELQKLTRMAHTKWTKLVSIINDTYDAYGTIQELELFTQAIQRWDKRYMNELPEYMKLIYETLLDTSLLLDDELAKQGRSYAFNYLQQEWKDLCSSYMQEAKWCDLEYIPRFDEYIKNGNVSSTYLQILAAAYQGMEIAHANVFEWLHGQPKPLAAICMIGRVLNDIATFKFEQNRKHVATSVECYMKQYQVSQDEACEKLQKMMEDGWKEVTESMFRPNAIPMPLLLRILNVNRVTNEIYSIDSDGYTFSKFSQDKITALLID
ncbi:sesquiterpene synthase-like isoform X2 [Amaranthus tricolor]|uniref:sesquiterpene synthase-like isoform X2 n=1 Tax=Amaranthus tricolor TaxID=29722 RepID=UPI00258B2AAA|nr:sesquiterpene synthase-like isoform X2 [Amaranthus tricolor]